MIDITFLSMNFDVGGAQRHTIDLARSLRDDYGLSVRMIGLSKERGSPLLEQGDLDHLVYLRRHGLGKLGLFGALFAEMHRVPSHILVGVNQAPMLAAWIGSRLGFHRGACVGVFHTTDLRDAHEERLQNIFDVAMRRLDKLVYVSANQRRHWEARDLINPDSEVILNGIDHARFEVARANWRTGKRNELGIADGELVVGYCARFRSEKNQRQLVDAVARLRARGIPAKALFVGAGPTEQETRAHAAAAGMTDACIFAGEHSDVRPFLAAMDVGVLCSTAVETLSLSALEMMATQMPVVLSRIGGADEIVTDGENGFLYEVGDLDGFVDRLARFGQDRDSLARMGENALETVRTRFSDRRMFGQYADLFRSMIAARPDR